MDPIVPSKRLQTTDAMFNSPSKRLFSDRDREELLGLARTIGDEFDFPLFVAAASNADWSNYAVTEETKCLQDFRSLFYNERRALEDAIQKFREQVADQKLGRSVQNLHHILQACKSASFNRNPSFNNSRDVSRSPSRAPSRQRYVSEFYSVSKSTSTLRSFPNSTDSAHTSFTSITEPDSQEYHDSSCIEAMNSVVFSQSNEFENPAKLENYRLRNLVRDGLFVESLPLFLEKAPPHVKYELVRLCLAFEASSTDLQYESLSTLCDRDALWTAVRSCSKSPTSLVAKTDARTWDAAVKQQANVMYSGSLDFAPSSSSSLFKLRLNPLSTDDRSFRFARKFGAHRFLRLSVPLDVPRGAHLGCDEDHYRQRLQDSLCSAAGKLMGYEWKVLLVRDAKSTRRKGEEYSRRLEVNLFAVRGNDLKTITIDEVVEWFMPITLNRNMTACKAYARLELGFSRTTATIAFQPPEIRRVLDIKADGTAEDSRFDDPNLDWPDYHDADQPKVMDDGCSVISLAAASRVWQLLGKGGALPSCFQARIGPWKGLWVVSSPMEPDSDQIWIKLTDSQCKFEPHTEDADAETCDEARLTFEVIAWSKPPRSGLMYLDYLPILQDRGVERQAMSTTFIGVLEKEKQLIDDALEDDATLAKWVQDEFGPRSRKDKGQFPAHSARKIRSLLESGFSVKKWDYVGTLFSRLARLHFSDLVKLLRIPMQKSTSLMGVPDPYGVLQPGEVHVAFSAPLVDEVTGSTDMILVGKEALISRHPAMRKSDIQKIRVVYKPQLCHLLDVIVFPTKGCIPLASKLQGGDYDGDRFWLCWEDRFVQPFQNAPAPHNQPTPEDFGISVDRTKLSELDMSSFLRRSFSFRLQPSFLGVCTNTHSAAAYTQNSLSSSGVAALQDIHDYLVDSAKNGYSFDKKQWRSFLKSHKELSNVPDINSLPFKKAATVELKEQVPHTGDNIIDYLLFDVVRRHATQILRDLDDLLKTVKGNWDEGIAKPYLDMRKSKDKDEQLVAKKLKSELEEIHRDYMCHAHLPLEGKTAREKDLFWDTVATACLAKFEKLQPPAQYEWWRMRPAGVAPSHWELVKASALCVEFSGKPDFVFPLAGYYICYLKVFTDFAAGHGWPGFVRADFHDSMKLRKFKKTGVVDAVAEVADEESDDEDDRFEDPFSVFDDAEGESEEEGDDVQDETQYFDAEEYPQDD